jgi:uncharacterized protein (DUF1501 family)
MNRHTRREFLGAGLVGTLSLALSPSVQRLLAADASTRRARACILVWLNGGPSHIDTFDPKPGSDTNGPFKAIETKVTGVRFGEHLPKLAAMADRLAVVRSLTSPEGDHDRAYKFLHTGNIGEETVQFPALGAVVAHERAEESDDLPPFVALAGPSEGPGFLGSGFAPYVLPDVSATPSNVALPEGVDEDRQARRLKALERLDGGFRRRASAAEAAEHARATAKAEKFRRSPALKAFDLSGEKPATLASYGVKLELKEGEEAPHPFGQACLLARRLVEHGTRFVEVMLDGWDTHADNFNQVQALCQVLDPAVSSLVGDLRERGLLDSTLVLVMGEFGRTPVINGDTGRDHHSAAFSAMLAGGGVKGGQVIGASDDKGDQVKDRPVTVPDLYATLLTAFGLDPAKTYRTPGGRPIKLADKGKVVTEVFG